MKIDNIPKENRVDLAELPQTNILKAVKEYMVDATDDKTGGLVVKFIQQDEKELSQKYGKVSGTKLIEAMERLGLTDTTQLQKCWFKYKLTAMRSGYPRYMPIEKVKDEV